ncbi:hypothetical protein BHAOGJBA_0757 [Methylobacterium hispanicum]|uniref:DNA-directed DNA polymerase family A palm domain-containing protein n=1 Tax=Methylobacterium hispanicum TaxID=270350 RepID=A0AAV4ZGA1_9HYPH|nr:hypothetical protein [Methylobacterium hispanicum]GJD87257.1 hypothetical protein BHAOGJBA_0757 [Methylobacterium hispanicum]
MHFVQGDDAPLSFAHLVPESALARLGIPRGRTRDDRAVQRAIIGQALVRHDGGGGRISYSRSGEWWKLDRYEGTPFGRSRVLGTVDALTDRGLLGSFRAKPGAHLAEEERDRLQSAFWATESLVEALRGEAVEHRRPRVPVLLRDENGDPMPLPRAQEVDRIVRKMERRNEAISGIGLSVDPAAVAKGLWRFSDHHWWALSDKGEWTCVLHQEFPHMVQMFARRSFDLHGRMYGPWSNLPAARRAELLLNGEAVCAKEPDWRCLHLDLAYAMCGARLDGDAYEVRGATGVRRGQLKMAVNAYMNAADRTATIRSLMLKRRETGKDGRPAWPRRMTWDQTAEVLSRIEERHEPIRAMFGSDAGVRLMRIDAEMAGQVMDACAKASIPCLPVHDSFSVPGRHEGFVKGVMGEVLERTRNKLSGTSTTTYPVVRLHYAPPGAGGPGAEPLGNASVEPRDRGAVEVPGPSGEAPSEPPVSTRTLAPAPSQDGPQASVAVSYPEPRTSTRILAHAVLAVPWPLQDVSSDPRTSTSEPTPEPTSRAGRTAPSTVSTSSDPRDPSPAIPDRLCPTLRLDMTTCHPAVVAIPAPHPHVIYDVDGTPVRGMPVMLRPMAQDLIAAGHDPYTPPVAPSPKVAPGLPSGIVPRAPWPYTAGIR